MSHVFLSYSRRDAEQVRRLFSKLEQAGVDVWLDRDDIRGGDQWRRQIVAAVDDCGAFIIVLSPNSVRSDNVRKELDLAESAHKRILPVEIVPVEIPPEMRYQLVGLQRISLTPNFDDGVAQLLEVLSVEPAPASFSLPLLEWVDVLEGSVEVKGQTRQREQIQQRFQVAAFKMSKYPITYAQFQAFIDAPDGFYNDAWWAGLHKREVEPGKQEWPVDNHPRENVSWLDAVAFCRWLSANMGRTVRLPTEWEWQWAAQGGDGREYPWGSAFEASCCNTNESGINQVTPVDRYPAGESPFGVIDMSGNVWEWCLNEYDVPGNVRLGGNAPRVWRGGSWRGDKQAARVTYRNGSRPGRRDAVHGFRVVAT